MGVGIIRNNSLVGDCAQAEVQTLAPERVTLYCTRRLSALTVELHELIKIFWSKSCILVRFS